MAKSKMSKRQLEILLQEVYRTLQTAVADAEKASSHYSDDIDSRRAFECGFLGSRINTTVGLIDNFIPCNI